MNLGNLDQASVYSYGGYSVNRETLVDFVYNANRHPKDLAEFDELAKNAGIDPGGEWWLSGTWHQSPPHPHAAAHQLLKQKKADAEKS